MDIVETSEGSRTGYLAVDAVEYANCIAVILYNSKEENDTIRAAARLVSSMMMMTLPQSCLSFVKSVTIDRDNLI